MKAMKKKSKGQGALEYLMTYGWALLVIVVVGAALFALGVFNPPATSSCNGFTTLTFQDQKMTTSEYYLDILAGSRDILITQIDVTPEGDTTRTTTGLVKTIAAGQRSTVNMSSSSMAGTGKIAGNSFKATVKLTYNVSGGLSGQSDTATCIGKVQ